MKKPPRTLREHAREIWQAGVDAVAPDRLIRSALRVRRARLEVGELSLPLDEINSIAVVGAGKAGAAMSRAVEAVLGERLMREHHLHGCVNVPDRCVVPLQHIELHPARAKPDNQPTPAGVAGSRRIRGIA